MNKCDRCLSCKVFEEVIKQGKFCLCACSWYIDNVVCGNKTADDCPDYKKVDD